MIKKIIFVFLALLLAACEETKEDIVVSNIQLKLGKEIFSIPEDYVGSRYNDNAQVKDINVTVLLPNLVGLFSRNLEENIDENQIDIMWSRRGVSKGYDAEEKLYNLIEFMDIPLVNETENSSEYYSSFSDKRVFMYRLSDGNKMLVDCPASEPKVMCRNFYFDKIEKMGVFFAFHKKHLNRVEEIYLKINSLIKGWRQN